MKTTIQNLLATIFVAASLQVNAQGTLIYDQQSAAGPVALFNNKNVDGLNIQSHSLTQAFIPTLSAIGFVQFEFWDIPNNGNNGATVYVNLWTGSPNVNSATFLGSSTQVYMPNGFVNSGLDLAGVTNFYFPNAISLVAGQIYYLQPVVLSGDNPWDIIALNNNPYLGGGLYFGGVRSENTSLLFREGIVSSVPEPSMLALLGLSGLLLFSFKRHRTIIFLAGVALATLANTQTFYLESLGGPGSVPYPMNPYDSSVPVTEISTGHYLVQDGPPSIGSRFELMSFSSVPFPGDDGTGGSDTNGGFESHWSGPSYSSNDLWLSIDAVSNGISYIGICPRNNRFQSPS